MDFHHFESFLAVARLGNLTKAAEEVAITQPALSRQMQSLEAGFGVRLFDRTGRGMELTDAGVILRGYADRCLSLVADCRQAMADTKAGVAGRIVIGVGGTHPMYELPDRLRAFAQRYPAVDITIRTGRSQAIIAALRDRLLDLAFVRVPITEPGIREIALYEEPFLLVSRPGQFVEGSVLSPDELQSAPLILYPAGTSFRSELDTALGALAIEPRVRMETDSTEEIRRFVLMGLGLGFLPASLIADDLARGDVVQIEVRGLRKLTRKTSLVFLENRYRSAAVREFMSMFVDSTRPGARRGS